MATDEASAALGAQIYEGRIAVETLRVVEFSGGKVEPPAIADLYRRVEAGQDARRQMAGLHLWLCKP